VTYIYGIIIIGLFFAALNYFTDLTHTQKWWVITIVLSILAVIVMFNEYSEVQSEKTRKTAMKFNQGKTVKCDEVDVNNSNYSLSIGTYTFIGKENTPNAGEMISASTCE